MDIIAALTREFSLKPQQVENTVRLIDDGNTIPFIARYRKEATGSLDDQLLRALADRLEYLRGLDKRREEVLAQIDAQGKLTDELRAEVENAATLSEVEDLYRPYRPKRKTRASVAKEKGLEPLALTILKQEETDPAALAQPYVSAEKGIDTVTEALQGASDILAELVSDDAAVRKLVRAESIRTGETLSKATEEARTKEEQEEKSVYGMYFDFAEPVRKIAGHRVLALDRGEREGQLKVRIQVDAAEICRRIQQRYVKRSNACGDIVAAACDDAYDRLIAPSIEREIRSELTEKASEQAIRVFAENLRQLLMQPPVKGAVTLGLDPAYRTGCKIAVVDGTGKVLDTAVVYPTPPQNKVEEAKKKLCALIEKYGVTVIAIGNGTASRESEAFVAGLLKEIDATVGYAIVSEAGASVYSASKLAAEEFPQYDVSLRSAVSIARRLQDPLAELVKIDPKSIGVGQYQHDMPQKRLDGALDGVVESCVNTVGVDLNTASQPLLSHIAGLSGSVAKNVIAYREENGPFPSRQSLLKVPKLGKKAFEQCAGFLRIPDAKNVLDATAVHPQSYQSTEKLLSLCGYTLADVKNGALSQLSQRAEEIGMERLCAETGEGELTLRDIIAELQKPGRDPRDELPPPVLRADVLELSDLKEGMQLQGTVRNITDFGAFVDIGVHEDGLVHISQMSDRYIKHPLEVVKVGQVVTVWVLGVDEKRKRISLTMKTPKRNT